MRSEGTKSRPTTPTSGRQDGGDGVGRVLRQADAGDGGDGAGPALPRVDAEMKNRRALQQADAERTSQAKERGEETSDGRISWGTGMEAEREREWKRNGGRRGNIRRTYGIGNEQRGRDLSNGKWTASDRRVKQKTDSVGRRCRTGTEQGRADTRRGNAAERGADQTLDKRTLWREERRSRPYTGQANAMVRGAERTLDERTLRREEQPECWTSKRHGERSRTNAGRANAAERGTGRTESGDEEEDGDGDEARTMMRTGTGTGRRRTGIPDRQWTVKHRAVNVYREEPEEQEEPEDDHEVRGQRSEIRSRERERATAHRTTATTGKNRDLDS